MGRRSEQEEHRGARGSAPPGQASSSPDALRRRLTGLERRYHERTEQVRALASELGQAEERERRRIGELLHDHVQQLLVGIQARGRLLASHLPAGTTPARRHLREIERLADQALELVRTLTAELAPPPPEDRRLRGLCERLAAEMRQRHALEVAVEVPAGLRLREEIHLLLGQMLRELLFNVVKHAGVGRATLAALAGDDLLEVTVADGGRGFDPDAALPRDAPGGYGLPAARRRLALLGGALEVASRPGTGTRCTVRLPRRICLEETAGRRVLLVEDHPAVRAALAELLDGQPDLAVCATAASAAEAERAAADGAPEIALVDLHLGADDGVHLIARLRAAHPELPVLAVSSDVGSDTARRATAAGAADLRAKDDLPGLLAAVRRLLPASADAGGPAAGRPPGS